MTTLRQAAQQALEALKSVQDHRPNDETNAAVTALRDALAQEDEMREMLRTLGFGSQCPESIGITLRRWRDGYAAALAQEEPVAWRAQNATPPGGFVIFQQYPQALADLGGEIEPLYTHPPRREWQSLSEEEIRAAQQAEPVQEPVARECSDPMCACRGGPCAECEEGRREKEIEDLRFRLDFYQRRCEALQSWQSKMRDPERTIVCDILANGFTLDPAFAGDRYTAPPQRQPLTQEEIVEAVREADLDWQAGWTLDERAPNRFVTLARVTERTHGIVTCGDTKERA